MSQSVSHTKRVERSTDRNLSPIFTKLATKVESQEVWLLWKHIFNVKYLENGERYDVRLKGGQIGNRPWAFHWDHDL